MGEPCHTPTVDVIIAEPRVPIVTLYIDIRALSIMVAQPMLFKILNIFPITHNYMLSRKINICNIHLNFISDSLNVTMCLTAALGMDLARCQKVLYQNVSLFFRNMII